MKTVNGEYSEKENAWVSEKLNPTGDIWLECKLPDYGYLIIRQTDPETGKSPKVYQSWERKEFKLRIFANLGYDIQIFTSITPKEIKYANI